MSKRYLDAMHGMQAGVGVWMEVDPSETTPKQLRVGVNAAMSDQCGLVTLLIEKGLFTKDEYEKAVTQSMESEHRSYEKRVSDHFGKKVTLV